MISGPARPKLVTSIKTQASSGIWGSGCHRNQTRAVCWGWLRISSKQRDNTRSRWFLLKLLFTSSLKQIEIIKSRRLISCPKPVSLLFISHLFLSPNHFFPFCSLSSLITGTTGDERWSHETSHHWETCDLDDHHLLRVVQDDLGPLISSPSLFDPWLTISSLALGSCLSLTYRTATYPSLRSRSWMNNFRGDVVVKMQFV